MSRRPAGPPPVPRPGRYPSSAALIAEAVEATGLTDFGPGPFQDGLDALLDSLERDGGLHPSTDTAVLGVFRRRLVNRLRIEEWLRLHPEVAALDIDGPVSITGLPRTGTTALANMMSIDDQFRCLRSWEQSEPLPPPVLGEEGHDPRRVAAARAIRQLIETEPDQRAMHIYETDVTSEDAEVMGLSFRSQQFTLPVPGYRSWWRDADLGAMYAHHRRLTRVLQSRRPPNRWLFKAPHHKFHLEDLVSAYPDARFVMTHRDPAKAIPSYASFVLSLFPRRADGRPHDPVGVGREVCDHLRIGMERAMAARARLGEHRFLDVQHRDFSDDPFRELERIYAFLGFELRPDVRDEMVRWHREHHTGAHGTHRYTPEQFGLSRDQIRADYAPYIGHFGVAVEG